MFDSSFDPWAKGSTKEVLKKFIEEQAPGTKPRNGAPKEELQEEAFNLLLQMAKHHPVPSARSRRGREKNSSSSHTDTVVPEPGKSSQFETSKNAASISGSCRGREKNASSSTTDTVVPEPGKSSQFETSKNAASISGSRRGREKNASSANNALASGSNSRPPVQQSQIPTPPVFTTILSKTSPKRSLTPNSTSETAGHRKRVCQTKSAQPTKSVLKTQQSQQTPPTDKNPRKRSGSVHFAPLDPADGEAISSSKNKGKNSMPSSKKPRSAAPLKSSKSSIESSKSSIACVPSSSVSNACVPSTSSISGSSKTSNMISKPPIRTTAKITAKIPTFVEVESNSESYEEGSASNSESYEEDSDSKTSDSESYEEDSDSKTSGRAMQTTTSVQSDHETSVEESDSGADSQIERICDTETELSEPSDESDQLITSSDKPQNPPGNTTLNSQVCSGSTVKRVKSIGQAHMNHQIPPAKHVPLVVHPTKNHKSNTSKNTNFSKSQVENSRPEAPKSQCYVPGMPLVFNDNPKKHSSTTILSLKQTNDLPHRHTSSNRPVNESNASRSLNTSKNRDVRQTPLVLNDTPSSKKTKDLPVHQGTSPSQPVGRTTLKPATVKRVLITSESPALLPPPRRQPVSINQSSSKNQPTSAKPLHSGVNQSTSTNAPNSVPFSFSPPTAAILAHKAQKPTPDGRFDPLPSNQTTVHHHVEPSQVQIMIPGMGTFVGSFMSPGNVTQPAVNLQFTSNSDPHEPSALSNNHPSPCPNAPTASTNSEINQVTSAVTDSSRGSKADHACNCSSTNQLPSKTSEPPKRWIPLVLNHSCETTTRLKPNRWLPLTLTETVSLPPTDAHAKSAWMPIPLTNLQPIGTSSDARVAPSSSLANYVNTSRSPATLRLENNNLINPAYQTSSDRFRNPTPEAEAPGLLSRVEKLLIRYFESEPNHRPFNQAPSSAATSATIATPLPPIADFGATRSSLPLVATEGSSQAPVGITGSGKTTSSVDSTSCPSQPPVATASPSQPPVGITGSGKMTSFLKLSTSELSPSQPNQPPIATASSSQPFFGISSSEKTTSFFDFSDTNPSQPPISTASSSQPSVGITSLVKTSPFADFSGTRSSDGIPTTSTIFKFEQTEQIIPRAFRPLKRSTPHAAGSQNKSSNRLVDLNHDLHDSRFSLNSGEAVPRAGKLVSNDLKHTSSLMKPTIPEVSNSSLITFTKPNSLPPNFTPPKPNFSTKPNLLPINSQSGAPQPNFLNKPSLLPFTTPKEPTLTSKNSNNNPDEDIKMIDVIGDPLAASKEVSVDSKPNARDSPINKQIQPSIPSAQLLPPLSEICNTLAKTHEESHVDLADTHPNLKVETSIQPMHQLENRQKELNLEPIIVSDAVFVNTVNNRPPDADAMLQNTDIIDDDQRSDSSVPLPANENHKVQPDTLMDESQSPFPENAKDLEVELAAIPVSPKPHNPELEDKNAIPVSPKPLNTELENKNTIPVSPEPHNRDLEDENQNTAAKIDDGNEANNHNPEMGLAAIPVLPKALNLELGDKNLAVDARCSKQLDNLSKIAVNLDEDKKENNHDSSCNSTVTQAEHPGPRE